MRQPDITPYSLYALQATEYAQEQDRFDQFHRAAFRAYWVDRQNLGDLGVVRQISEAVDLDWDVLGPLLVDEHYMEAVLSQYQQAYSIGVNGIPAFAIGKYVFSGARPYEFFQSVVERVLNEQ